METARATGAELTGEEPLIAHRWYFVVATYDAAAGRTQLTWTMLRRSWLPEEFGGVTGVAGLLATTEAPLVIGAAHLEQDARGKRERGVASTAKWTALASGTAR